MLVYFILLMFYIFHGGTCLEGLNVCEDLRSKTEYCCAGYEDKHGTCIECNNGFTSINGNACTSCKNNRFGKRCLSRCNCQSEQERCDNVAGCVPKTEVSEEVVYTTKTLERGFPGTIREDDLLSTEVQEKILPEAVTEHAKSGFAAVNTNDDTLSVTSRDNDFVYTLSFADHTYDSTRTQKRGIQDIPTENTAYSTRPTEKDFSEIQSGLKLKLFVYCGGIAGVIILIGLLCCACEQFRRRRQNPNRAITNDENRILRASGKENQPASEQKKSMHIYHVIDENILGGQSTNCYASSEVMIESSSQKGKQSGPACSYTQHAQQYQCLVPADIEMHLYK